MQKAADVKRITNPNKAYLDRLFVLDLSGGHILSVNTDGSDEQVLVSGCHLPDGIVVDMEKGYLYWTNMGVPNLNDGSIERVDLDGRNRKVIVPKGSTHTPKQLCLVKSMGKVYWSDREGMRVMRCNLNGSDIETLVETGHGDTDMKDATKWCVGMTVDASRGHMYWTQKGPDDAGKGRIFRANLEIPKGESPTNRKDIEVLFDHLPEPIDLELDLDAQILYWTDRGDPPRGNTVNRASIAADAKGNQKPKILLTHLMEGIGIALDLPGKRMFVTDLAGSVYSANIDGSEKKALLFMQGNLTGIAYVKTAAKEK